MTLYPEDSKDPLINYLNRFLTEDRKYESGVYRHISECHVCKTKIKEVMNHVSGHQEKTP